MEETTPPEAGSALRPDAGPGTQSLFGVVAARPRAAAAAGAACIAFSGLIFRVSAVQASTATFFRCLLALPFLLVLARLEDRRFGPRPAAERRWALVAGLFFAADLQCFHAAVTFVGAGLGTVLPNLQVIAVAIATWLLFGERPPTRAVAAVPVVLGGILLISGVLERGAYGANPVAGAILGAAAGFFYAGFLVIIRRMARDRRRAAGPLLDATFSTALVVLPVGLLLGDLDLGPGWTALGWLAAVALTSQVLGYLLITISLPRLPAILSSLLLFVQPVGTISFAAILLGERPSPLQLAGVALVLGGVGVAALPLGRIARARRRSA